MNSSIASHDSLPAFFAGLAVRHGGRPALASERWAPSYGELNAAANRAAHALMRAGVRPGARVAVLARHDAPQVASMLATVKAGAIGVVLVPSHPAARLRALMDDSGAGAILADRDHRGLAEAIAGAAEVLDIDDVLARGPDHDPAIPPPPDGTAFLIYTSGSTGDPKGVMQTHRQVIANAQRLSRAMTLAPDDRVAWLANLGGGQGIAVVWSAFAAGATLHPFAAAERGVATLGAWLRDHAITAFISSASLFRQVAATIAPGREPTTVRVMRVASEPATSDDFRAFLRVFPNARTFVHTLASSECGNIACHGLGRDARVGEGRLPVGAPLPGMAILLLGDDGRPVAPGAEGEIVVRGDALSAGYWRDAALTAARYAADPDQPGVTRFRSGDIGRINAEGLLEFIGRRDDRLKIRGHRIDPEEISLGLERLPGVTRAQAVAIERPGREPMLVAYVAAAPEQSPSPRALRLALQGELPAHMIPSRIALIEAFPLTPQGKIDRDALRRIPLGPAQTAEARSPTPTEALLSGIWAEALEVDDPGPADDFFELGGDSLNAAAVAARVHAVFAVEMDLGMLTAHPTLAALARAIDAARGAAGAAGPSTGPAPVPRDRPLPLSYPQESIWRYSQTREGSAGYTVAYTHAIDGPLDAALLARCIDALAMRHEILRTRFTAIDGQPAQIVQPGPPSAVEIIDLSATDDPVARATRFVEAESTRVFTMSETSLMRFWILRIAPDRHWLLRVGHHILFDGWSWSVFMREIASLYEAKRTGRQPDLGPPPTQYGDYAVWQRAAHDPDSPSYRAAIAWWRDQLADLPAWPGFSFARREPAHGLASAEGLLNWGVAPATSRALDRLGRQEGATFYMTRLAALAVIVAVETGARDVVIGSYASDRAATHGMFGFTANLLALRFRCDFDIGFREWLAATRRVVLDALSHADVPFESLCAELRQAGAAAPDVRVIFNVVNRYPVTHFAGVRMAWRERHHGAMPWGLTIRSDERDEAAHCRATFDAGLYEPAGVRRMLDRLARLLDAAARDPDGRIGDLLREADAASAG